MKTTLLIALVLLTGFAAHEARAESPEPVQTISPNAQEYGCGLKADSLFKPIVCLPFFTGENAYDLKTGLPDLLNALFQLALSAGTILAVLMLIAGGFEYMTQGSVLAAAVDSHASGGSASAQKHGRERIQGAIIGLILLFASYLIIYIISPDILQSIKTVEFSALRGTGPAPANNTATQQPAARINCQTADCFDAKKKCTDAGGQPGKSIVPVGGSEYIECPVRVPN